MMVLRSLVALVQTTFFLAVVWACLPAQYAQVVAAPPAASAPPAKKAATDRAAARAKPFEPEKLFRAFRGKREDVRLKALGEMERLHLADAALPEVLWKIIEPPAKLPRVPDSILYALRLYGQIEDPQSDKRLISLLAAADLRVVLSAIDFLAERRPPESFAPLAALRERAEYGESYALRHAVVSSVAKFNEPASVDFLISTLGSADGQLKYVAAVALTRLTGEKFGGKSGEWQKWWQARRQGYRIMADGTAKPPAGPLPWDSVVPQFYGVPVYAKRVVFVIDRSKSMESSVDGVTRLDDAAGQLEAAVRGLPDDAYFEIIAYNDTDLSFAGKLVQATPQAKSDAARFMYSLSADGRTDSFDALADALQVDQNIEAILFLSDGDPNVGRLVDRTAIVTTITQQNKSLRAAINTIGIDARGPSEDFLKQLAGDNFGEYGSIR
jgi:hypothetical protein